MRSLSIHPLSLALGFAFGLVCFLTMGQASIRASALGSTVRIEYLAHPRDMVQIREGTPYTVPAGKLFVLTAIGLGSSWSSPTGGSCPVRFLVNGLDEFYSSTSGGIQEVPTGLAVRAGDVIALAVGGGSACTGYESRLRAWGYLAPQ